MLCAADRARCQRGLNTLLEARRTFVCVRLDMSNGYNACSRSVLLRRLSEHAGLEHLVPPLHALGAEAPDLLIGACLLSKFPRSGKL